MSHFHENQMLKSNCVVHAVHFYNPLPFREVQAQLHGEGDVMSDVAPAQRLGQRARAADVARFLVLGVTGQLA